MKTKLLLGRASLLLACGGALLLNNCADEGVAETGVDVGNLVEVDIEAGGSLPLVATLDEPTTVVVTVDCKVPSNVDLPGSLIAVEAESMSQAEALAGQPRAAYWQWAGTLEPGEHPLTIHNVGEANATCGVSMQLQGQEASEEEEEQGGTCSDWTVHRSVIGHATHLPVGNTEYGTWEELPASGNHWGAWAAWGSVYEAPVLRGFYLHNLEHGGLILSYGCESADESEDCAAARDALIDLANEFGERRIIVTPDPTQPTMFALRGWRWAYASDCLNVEAGLRFMKQHFRQGREDVDADPPLPFDPTSTENVPCEVLMAAPDGC